MNSLITGWCRDGIGTALDYKSVVPSIVYGFIFPLLNFHFHAPVHVNLSLGGHHFQRKITHVKHRKYTAMNISWGKSQYKIRVIQELKKDCGGLSPRKLCSRTVSGQAKPTIVSAVMKPMSDA